MPSPFPGMDPYIERPTLWPDFHDRFITYLCAALNPVLRPRYAALTQDRLYVTESHRPIYPDVGIVRTSRRTPPTNGGGVAVLDIDAPAVFEIEPDEIREPFIKIIEPAAGNRVVTAIEVLSPTNKTAGDGQQSYWKKREELWAGNVNLVEIDLLRDGDRTVRVSSERLESLRPWHYIIAVSRRQRYKQEVYARILQRPLPTIMIPLAHDDKDVPLDLQAAFTRCWDDGAYPELLGYDEPPPGTLSADEVAWCAAIATATRD